jgi:purine-nucleoside phosphorylase
VRPRPAGKILVLSGWEPELALLRAALAEEPALAKLVVACPAGVGLVEAGIGAARAIAEVKPRVVFFVGTAGAYGKEPALGTAIAAAAVKLVSTAAVRKDGYLPAVLPASATTDAGLRRQMKLPAADVACPLAITSSRALARRIAAASGCAVENLEAFAVARAAGTLPFAAILGVSNAVGPAAHAQWRAHAASAAAAACQAVVTWLRATIRSSRRRP